MAIESAGKVELPQPEEGRFMVRDVLCFVCSCNLFVFPLSILLSLVVVMQRRKRAVEGTAEESGFQDVERAHKDADYVNEVILTYDLYVKKLFLIYILSRYPSLGLHSVPRFYFGVALL